MRVGALTTGEDDTLNGVCTAYGVDLAAPPRQISERVWRLDTHAGVFAVKSHRMEAAVPSLPVGPQLSTGPTLRARALKEAQLIEYLRGRSEYGDRAKGFNTQTLMRTLDGELAWTGTTTGAILTRWEAGSFKTYDTFSLAEWRALGSSLAALHLALESSAMSPLDTLGHRLSTIDIDSVRATLLRQRHDPRGQTARFVEYVRNCLSLLDEYYPGSVADFPSDDPQHAIHNDFNQFNYLFDGSSPDTPHLPVILDWEAAIGAPREYEVVRCLNHLPLERPERAAEFVQAYRSVHPLDAARMEWAVDAACVQHGLKSWIREGWLDSPAAFGEHLNGSARLAAILTGARTRLITFYLRCLDVQL